MLLGDCIFEGRGVAESGSRTRDSLPSGSGAEAGLLFSQPGVAQEV